MKEKFDPGKNYPNYNGVVNIKATDAYALAEYIMNGIPSEDKDEILLSIGGWKKTSEKTGVPYLSLQFTPHYQYKAKPSDKEVVNEAAKQLATATGGTVTFDDEVPF